MESNTAISLGQIQSKHRLLSNLTAKDTYHSQFFEYQQDTYDFNVHRDTDGSLYTNVVITLDDQVAAEQNTENTTIFRVECPEVTNSIAKCYNSRFNFELDIYTYDDAATTRSGYPTVLYTGTDGKIHRVEDAALSIKNTTNQTQAEEGSSLHVSGNISNTEVMKSSSFSGHNGWLGDKTSFAYGVGIGVLSAVCALLMITVGVLVLHRRRQRREKHKQFMEEIRLEGTIKHTQSRHRSRWSSSGQGDDSTEAMEFSEEDDIDPKELREVDLTV